jgi:endonuclease/exonuclease/phosphatase family metal-dependent hydrolase
VPTLRLATFNVFSGRSLADGRTDPGRLRDAVASLDADVVAAQEVDRHQPRSGGTDQAATVAQGAGAREGRFVKLVDGTPGEPGWSPSTALLQPLAPSLDGAGPAPTYGIVLVTRLPVLAWHVLALRPPRGRYPIPVPTRPPRLIWIPDEPRAAVAAVVGDGAGAPLLTVACTHLSFVPGANVRQLRAVTRWLADLPGPRVLLGDLNLPGSLPVRATRWTPLVTGATYPSPAPRLQIDHALASGLPPAATWTGTVRLLPLSDHRAAQVDLTLP